MKDIGIISFGIVNHNQKLFDEAIKIINSFIELNEDFKVYLYDGEGDCFIPSGKIEGVLMQITEK